MVSVDEYIRTVINPNDKESSRLAKKFAPTLKYRPEVRIIEPGMGGINVLKIPEGYCVFVHSAGGDPKIVDLMEYGESAIDKLLVPVDKLGLEPLAILDAIESRAADDSVEVVSNALLYAAKENQFAVMNGEHAILGDRVRDANVTVTMISMIPVSELNFDVTPAPIKITEYGTNFGVFLPQGFVYGNSDTVGTKTRWYEVAQLYHLASDDSAAMKLDDTVKVNGAKAKIISDICDTKGDVPFQKISNYARNLGVELGLVYMVDEEKVSDRICTDKNGIPAFHQGGSVVSDIDPEKLLNPLKPSEGEDILAIYGGIRSNGVTSKTKGANILGKEICEKEGAAEWYNTAKGREIIQHLTTPSTIFYPLFRELISLGLAKSVYHMSGGAYKGKLARPMTKHGLHASLDNLFPPSPIELEIAAALGTRAEDAYGQWPMSNEGFITTNSPLEAIKIIEEYNYRVKWAGRVTKEKVKTGASMRTFGRKEIPSDKLSKRAINYRDAQYGGRVIHFSGKD